MTSFNLSVNPKTWVLIITLLIIGLLFSLYFLEYIPSQENAYIKREYRILGQMGNNLMKTYQVHKKAHDKGLKAEFVPAFEDWIVLREDAFDEFFIMHDDTLIYQTFDNQLEVIDMDSLMTYDAGLQSGNVRTIRTSNQSYKIFIYKTSFELAGAKKPLYLCGLVLENRYRQEIREVESYILVNATLVLLFIVMSMGLLKLLLMSPIERLYISNIIWVGASLIFGTALLTMLLLSGYNYYHIQDNQIDKSLKSLSNEINTDFREELKHNYGLLESFEDIMSDTEFTEINEISFDTTLVKNVYELDNVGRDLQESANFAHLFWSDTGRIRLVFTPVIVTPKISKSFADVNINERTYFSDVLENKTWNLPGEANKKFAMQSIVSWADLNYELAVSKASEVPWLANGVVAVTSKSNTVMDPVLPPGFGFCIIDKEGKVWFHSDIDKNRQENFLEESSGNSNLKSALQGNIAIHTNAKYFNKWHRFYTQPMGDIPLDLVVFYDLDYLKTPLAQTMTITLFLICSLFTLLAIQVVILFWAEYNFKILKVKRYSFEWLNPKSGSSPIFKYKLLFLNNALIIAWFLMSIIYDRFHQDFGMTPMDTIFLVMIIPIYMLLFNFLVLKYKKTKESKIEQFMVGSAGLIFLINFLFESNFQLDLVKALLFQFIFSLFLLVLFSSLISKPDKSPSWINFIFKVTGALRRLIRVISPPKPYILFLTTWLVISSIIPVFYIYTFAFDNEQLIWQKQALAKIAQNLDNRNRRIDRQYSEKLAEDTLSYRYIKDKLMASRYYEIMGYYPDSAANSRWQKPDKSIISNGLETLLFYLRPPFNDLALESKAFAFQSSSDGSRVWTKHGDTLNFQYSAIVSRGGGNKLYDLNTTDQAVISIYKNLSMMRDFRLHFSADQQYPKHLKISRFIIVIAVISLLIYFLYKITAFAVRKIYAQDFKNVDTDDMMSVDFLQQRKINNRVFIAGLPYSGRGEFLATYIAYLEEQETPFQIIDLRELNKADLTINEEDVPKSKIDTQLNGEDYEKSSVIFLMNFEYNLNNHKGLKMKLRVLEKFLKDREKQVIVSSEIHPLQVMDYYESLIRKAQGQGENYDLLEEYRQNLKLWQQIFRGFIKVYHPLKEYPVTFSDEHEMKIKYENKIKGTIKKELMYGNYLNKLEPLVYQYYKIIKDKNPDFGKTNLCQEDVILRIQSLAETYYQSIWNSLTKSEKYLIFDLAKDRFVNVKNDYDIKTLLSKGIFNYKDNLQLMNRSFNNFVINVVGSDQEIMMEKELRKKGNWSTIQLVLILTVISITVFIVLGQKNFVNEFNSLIGALGAVVGLLLRFGGIFTRSGSNIKA